jgi:transcriptional regulator with XRE-family HTH domain
MKINFRKSIHHELHRSLRKLLIEARKELDLTQRELAKKLSMGYQTIGKIESGDRRLDPVEFFEYAKALELDPSEQLFIIFYEYRNNQKFK